MRYQGGKARIAKDIAPLLGGGGQTLVSLFCGACNIEAKVKGFDRIICNDNHPYLIALFKALQNGYELPDEITEEQYSYIKDHKDDDPALTGFVGFACSFGGKWFAGYARDKQKTNYALRGKKSLESIITPLMNAEFICSDYKDVVLPDKCIVYADPPYENTTKYSNQYFDSKAFWEYMRKVSDDHRVYISELNAPDDFVSIWHKSITRTLDVNKDNYFKSVENLYIHKKWVTNID